MGRWFSVLIFTISLNNCFTQIWVAENPVWYYHYEKSDLASEYGEFKITDIGDSIIEGHNCQMLQQVKSIWYNSSGIGYYLMDEIVDTNYVRVEGDTVLYYQNGEFRVLYNFGSNVGDSWLTYVSEPSTNSYDSTYVIVSEKGLLNIQGVDYRYITLETVGYPNFRLSGTFVERFGKYSAPSSVNFSLGSLFPYNYVQPEFGWTEFFQTCFTDDSINYQAFSWCFADPALSEILEIESNLISIFPNPFDEFISIEASEDFTDCELLDSRGNYLVYFKSIEDISRFNFEELSSGLYFLKFSSENQIITKSIIKN